MKPNIYRDSDAYLKAQKLKTEKAWEGYLGKLALAKEYEEAGLPIPVELRARIRLKKQLLVNRGEL